VLTALLGPVGSARADGDPASDVLASQPLFVPADGGISAPGQSRLAGLLASARRSGFPIRVALIAAPADLGSVTELWRMPTAYARFLGQELSLLYRGPLLVVMPNGLGVYGVGEAAAATRTLSMTLDGFRAPGALVAATVGAVQRLAAAAGHHLTVPLAAAPSDHGSGLRSVDPGSWLALALGAVMVVLAWTTSLRARPPARRRDARATR
jgi:hypothetical protein